MRSIKTILRSFFQLFRKPVLFDDKMQFQPVSRVFGLDRGQPIDRYYIDSFLNDHRQWIKGNVLEIAENTYSKKFGSEVLSYEILHYDKSNRKATITGDLTKPETLPEEKADCFICTQTLNFIFDVPNAIKGSYKLLKPGGCLLCTVSGISQISRYDMDRWGDYWRFTDKSMQIMMEAVFGKGNVEVFTYGNALAATSFLQGLATEDLPQITLLDEIDNDYQVTICVKAVKTAK